MKAVGRIRKGIETRVSSCRLDGRENDEERVDGPARKVCDRRPPRVLVNIRAVF